MSLKQTHLEYIIEQLHLQYLEEGVIPTSDMIEEDLAAYQEEHPDLEAPTSKDLDLSVEHGANSSASQMHTIAEVFSNDIAIVTKELFRLSQEGEKFYDRWIAEIKRLSGYARELDDRIDSLLLLTYDTAGYFAHVGDVFASMNKVDTATTTARVNLNETAVTINPKSTQSDGSLGTQLDLSRITDNDISFRPLSTRPGTFYIPAGDESPFNKMFKSTFGSWVGSITCSTEGEMVAEFKVRFNRTQDKSISKVSMEYIGPNDTSTGTVTLQYSSDGYKWFLVPTQEATKTWNPKVTWFFPTVQAKWLKVIFRKPNSDSKTPAGQYLYEYAISNLKLFGHNYAESEGNIFVSTSLEAKDLEDNPVLFSTVALDACEEIPDSTSIEYYVSASRDNSTWTEWTRIEPTTKTNTLFPKVINFGGIDWRSNKTLDTSIIVLDTDITGNGAQLKLAEKFNNSEISDLKGYRFKNGTFAAINTAIVAPPNTPGDFINSNIVVWRNIRNKTIFDSPDSYPDTATVRGVPRGWGLNGSTYSCYFEIIDSQGRRLDFGDRTCVIDGSPVSGSILVPQGVHKFQTDSANWIDVSAALVDYGQTITTEDTLERLDPLYPYNHKYIIEGFPYASSFIGEKKYTGTDLSAEFYATQTSLFDLENNTQSNLGWFATRAVGTNDNSLIISVILETNPSNQDYINELSLIKWKTASEDVGYKYTKLKADFKTTDPKRTPILYSYRIKLGV